MNKWWNIVIFAQTFAFLLQPADLQWHPPNTQLLYSCMYYQHKYAYIILSHQYQHMPTSHHTTHCKYHTTEPENLTHTHIRIEVNPYWGTTSGSSGPIQGYPQTSISTMILPTDHTPTIRIIWRAMGCNTMPYKLVNILLPQPPNTPALSSTILGSVFPLAPLLYFKKQLLKTNYLLASLITYTQFYDLPIHFCETLHLIYIGTHLTQNTHTTPTETYSNLPLTPLLPHSPHYTPLQCNTQHYTITLLFILLCFVQGAQGCNEFFQDLNHMSNVGGLSALRIISLNTAGGLVSTHSKPSVKLPTVSKFMDESKAHIALLQESHHFQHCPELPTSKIISSLSSENPTARKGVSILLSSYFMQCFPDYSIVDIFSDKDGRAIAIILQVPGIGKVAITSIYLPSEGITVGREWWGTIENQLTDFHKTADFVIMGGDFNQFMNEIHQHIEYTDLSDLFFPKCSHEHYTHTIRHWMQIQTRHYFLSLIYHSPSVSTSLLLCI